MNLRTQVIIAAAVVVVLLIICNIIRKRKLELRYALIWLVVGVLVLLFDVCSPLLNGLTRLLGIELPVNMLFFAGICFLIIIVFAQTLTLSRLAEKVKRLTQEIALLEDYVERGGGGFRHGENKSVDDALEDYVERGGGGFRRGEDKSADDALEDYVEREQNGHSTDAESTL